MRAVKYFPVKTSESSLRGVRYLGGIERNPMETFNLERMLEQTCVRHVRIVNSVQTEQVQ